MSTVQVVQMVFDIIVLGIVLYAGFADLKTRLIPTFVQYIFLGVSLAHLAFMFIAYKDVWMGLDCLLTGSAVFLIYLIIIFIFEKGIGGGDTKMISMMSLYLGYEQAVMTVLFHCFSAFAYVLGIKIFKKKHIASVPALVHLSVGYIITKIIYWVIVLKA